MIHYKQIAFTLDTAVNENQYQELLEWSPRRIAEDLANYCSDYEDADISELIPLCRRWNEEQHVN